nr:DedA family protein/thiosulfate sulfurtransferase GlpE [Paraburkholderia pallida]
MPSLALFGAMAAMHPATAGSQLLPTFALAVLATLSGDSVLYLFGRRYGANALNTICELSPSRDACVKRTERFFGRWGVRILTVAKFIPGLSLVSIPMAGVTHTPWPRFAMYDSIGAALWTIAGLSIGMLFAPQLETLFALAHRFSHIAIPVVLAFLVAYAIYNWRRRNQVLQRLPTVCATVKELDLALRSNCPPVVLDVRTGEKRKLAPYIIPNSLPAEEDRLDEITARFPKNTKIIIYCSCHNEVSAFLFAKSLHDAGFSDVRALSGGIDAWRRAGHPVISLPITHTKTCACQSSSMAAQ